jgi:hypothetical protein
MRYFWRCPLFKQTVLQQYAVYFFTLFGQPVEISERGHHPLGQPDIPGIQFSFQKDQEFMGAALTGIATKFICAESEWHRLPHLFDQLPHGSARIRLGLFDPHFAGFTHSMYLMGYDRMALTYAKNHHHPGAGRGPECLIVAASLDSGLRRNDENPEIRLK